MNIRQVSLLVGVAVLAAGATYFTTVAKISSDSDPTGPKDKEGLTIRYKINDALDGLEIVSNNGKWPCTRGENKKGCFKIKKSDAGLITYTFDNTDSAWTVKQFTICQSETPITNSCDEDLTLDEQLEFFVMDDTTGTKILLTPKSGKVVLSPLGDGLRTFYLFDQNTIKQDYYYNIEVCSEAGSCLYLDPPVENKGRN
ncbi:MAG: hypothetical protein WBS20_03785 [Lysobacterales bacterium]